MISNKRVYHDVRCLSTDTKPTERVANGSMLTEIDTGKTFLFDAEKKQWNEVVVGGMVVSPIPTANIHSITGMGGE